jgi:hypothetical protein
MDCIFRLRADVARALLSQYRFPLVIAAKTILPRQRRFPVTAFSNPQAIRLPNGLEASFEYMQAYGSVLQAFIRDQEALLPAITDTKRHNDIIDYLRSLANGYNEQLRIYKEKEAQQNKLLMVMSI